ncbi:MAG: family 20 glycosylhydrolase, partial [Vicinamibacterales bacterium]|nr:family 20 glycosylhydrolase [Vicinamibacterales bacterium]
MTGLNTSRWFFALLGACLLFAGCRLLPPTYPPAPASVAVIPAPSSMVTLPGAFTVTAATRISAGDSVPGDSDTEWIARYFADLVYRTRGLSLPVDMQRHASHAPNRIAFVIDPAAAPGSAEGYALAVLPQGVTISAPDRRGLFYGAITLWQLLSADAGPATQVSLPALRITDRPRFGWRGVMLDSARHYQSPEFIERFIDWMALHKLNVLHWHLNDDQGWRLEIRKYPLLTQVGA